MPTNRTRRTCARRAAALPRDEFLDLMVSWMKRPPELDAEGVAAYWAAHGEALTAEWIAKRPGTRPRAWWEFDAPGPRRELNPPPEGNHLRGESRKRSGQVWLPGGGTLIPWLEEESEYLSRHGLLTDDERKALGSA